MCMYIYLHIYNIHTYTHCNTLQRTDTHCNTLKHIYMRVVADTEHTCMMTSQPQITLKEPCIFQKEP